MNLGNDPHRGTRLGRRKSGALAGKTSPDDQNVVLRHPGAQSIHAAEPATPPGRARVLCHLTA
jgi:hypothetical protein